MVANTQTTRPPVERVKAFFGIENADPDKRGFYGPVSCPTNNHKRGDQRPGLSFWETERGGVAFKCFAGCDHDEIRAALGLDLSTNGYKPTPRSERASVTVLEIAVDKLIHYHALHHYGLTDGYKYHGQETVRIPYRLRNGDEHTKIRVRYGKSGHDSSWVKESAGAVIPYGLWKLDEAEQAGYLVMGEGESDAWTCWSHNVPYLGIPGANNTGCLQAIDIAKELANIPRIYIIQEPDQAERAANLNIAAQGFYANAYKQLRANGYQGELYHLHYKKLTGYKDPNEMHQALLKDKTCDLFKPLLEEALQKADPHEETSENTTPRTLLASEALPEVVIGGQMRDTVNAAMAAIYQAEAQKQTIFVQSARLVQVSCDEKKRPIIMPMHVAEVKNALTRTANYFRCKQVKDENIAIPVSPPKEIAEAILALNPSEWKFPALEAIVETPVMRPDGSILDQPGYDKAAGLYYYPQAKMDTCKVPSNPSQKDVTNALALIEDAIGEFPYVDEADKANAFAVLLTPLLRHAIPRHVPMALIDAPKQGTGKGLLADTVSIIATGSSSPVLTMSDSEEELQKSLTSLLMQGATIITIDNIAGRLQSRHLDAVLTADHWRGRVLGESRMVTVAQRATWLATGNNIHLGGDLARRCYRIRLDPHVSRPWMRTGFKHEDLATWVKDHRGELIGALLTLARAWFVAGRPTCDETPSLGTFTGWTKMMGGILHLCGIDGFLNNLEKLYDEADEEAAQWEAFLQAWIGRHNDAWIKVGDLADQFKKELAGDDPKVAGVALSDFLPENLQLALKDKPQTFSVRLGKELGKRLETCFGNDNLRLVKRVDSHSKKTEWRVVAGDAGVVSSLRPVEKSGGNGEDSTQKNDIEVNGKLPPHLPQSLECEMSRNGLPSGTSTVLPLLNGHKATPASLSTPAEWEEEF